MLKKMKRKIILIEVLAFMMVTVVIIATINIVSHQQVVKNAHQTLEILAANQGELIDDDADLQGKHYVVKDYDMGFNSRITVETQYSTRFFYAVVNAHGTIVDKDLTHIAAVSDRELQTYVRRALRSKRKESNLGNYRYLRVDGEEEYQGDTLIYFVDCYMAQNYVRYIMHISLLIGGICMLLVCVFVNFLSGWAMRPMVENLQRQKQFVTDASHELKTPLAAISANVDVLELVSGEKEISGKIRRQVNQLSTLVNEMLTLTRLGDVEDTRSEAQDLSLDQLLRPLLSDFQPRVEQKDITLVTEVEEDLHLRGVDKELSRLLSVFLDNAVKYCTESGTITVKACRNGKKIHFSVCNSYEGIPEQDLPYLFERFYRSDNSRTRQTGSYGIGLSIAKAIVEKHCGTIGAANTPEGAMFYFDLPQNLK